MHRHAELEFNLVTQGAGLYLLANRKYQIRRGDLLWLFPAQEHVLIGQTTRFRNVDRRVQTRCCAANRH